MHSGSLPGFVCYSNVAISGTPLVPPEGNTITSVDSPEHCADLCMNLSACSLFVFRSDATTPGSSSAGCYLMSEACKGGAAKTLYDSSVEDACLVQSDSSGNKVSMGCKPFS